MGVKIKRTLGERIVSISDKLGVPRITVEQILREYLDSLTESAQRGETVVIDNIISIKTVEDENGGTSLRGRVSPALKNKVGNTKVGE